MCFDLCCGINIVSVCELIALEWGGWLDQKLFIAYWQRGSAEIHVPSVIEYYESSPIIKYILQILDLNVPLKPRHFSGRLQMLTNQQLYYLHVNCLDNVMEGFLWKVNSFPFILVTGLFLTLALNLQKN